MAHSRDLMMIQSCTLGILTCTQGCRKRNEYEVEGKELSLGHAEFEMIIRTSKGCVPRSTAST